MEKKSKKHIIITITSIIAIVIVFHVVGWLRPIEELLRRLIYPVSSGIYHISISLADDKVEEFKSIEELQQSYKKLHNQLIDAQVDQAQLRLLEQENEQLKQQLHFFSSSTLPQIGAEVIGKNIEPLSRSIILDKGTDSGIEEGNAVIVRNGILIGTIVRANEHTSIVRLINDNQSTIAATVINQDKSIGLIEGGFGLSVRMNFIPQNELVSIGDTIVSSGLNDNIPKGLVIGTIEAVEKEAYQPFQEAIVTPLVNLEKIDLVSIILTSDPYVEELPENL